MLRNIERIIDSLAMEVELNIVVGNKERALAAITRAALDSIDLDIEQIIFNEYWDEGIEFLDKKEKEIKAYLYQKRCELRDRVFKSLPVEVEDSFAAAHQVYSVESFLNNRRFNSINLSEEEEMAEYEAENLHLGCFGDLGYDEEFLNKVLFEYEEEIKDIEDIREDVDDIIEEQQQIKQFEVDAYAAGFDVVEYNARTIESDNRLDILYSRILVVAEGIDQVALLIRVDTPAKYRRIVINTNNAFVKNTFNTRTPFKEKTKRNRHKMDLQIKGGQGFEIAWMACMVHDIIDGVERDTYEGLFVSHKFDQGNRDTSYEPDNVSRVGVELLSNDEGINGRINAVHKFLNDAQNIYILEGKDQQLLDQLIQLKKQDPQQARDLACKLRRRTFISSDIKKNVWKF